MYLGPDDADFLEAVLREKTLRVAAEWVFPAPAPPRLHPQAQQWLVSHLFSPDSGLDRLLVNHETGTGKTLAALLTLSRFLEVRRRLVAVGLRAPRILVVGPEGSREAFRDEMLRYPEFGFIRPQDFEARRRLQQTAGSNPVQLAEFDRYLRRTITIVAAAQGVQLLGYQELANRVFRVARRPGQPQFDLARAAAAAESADDLDRVLREAEARGDLEVAPEFFRGFEHGLLIADEFHHVYNRQRPNTWGVAVRLLLGRVPSMRALFLSATPLGHPLEIVDLGNFLQSEARLARRDFFRHQVAELQEVDLENAAAADDAPQARRRRREPKSGRARGPARADEPPEAPAPPRREWVLREGAAAKLGKLLRGRVSFFRLADVRNFAARTFPAKAVPLDTAAAAPPLNVVLVPPCGAYLRAYRGALEGGRRLPTDGRSLLDMVFPAPPRAGGGDDGLSKNIVSAVIGSTVGLLVEHGGSLLLALGGGEADSDPADDLAADPGAGPPADVPEADPADDLADDLAADPAADLAADPEADPEADPGASAVGAGDCPPAVFRTGDIRAVARAAPADWARQSGLLLAEGGPFAGDWLRLGRGREPSLESFAPKYAALVRDVRGLMGRPAAAGGGKIFLYHPRVSGSGILQLAELFLANGFLGLGDPPAADTLCVSTGLTFAEHSARARRDPGLPPFAAARLIVLTGAVPKPELRRLLELYNAPENLGGREAVLLLASQVLTEGYTLRAVRHEVFASPPLDIAEFLQVLGRVFRYGVHGDLPEAQRTVQLHVYAYRGLLDERIYRALMRQYEAISVVMRELHRGAADAALFHPRLFPDLTHYFGSARARDNPAPGALPADYAALARRFPEAGARRDFGPLFFWPAQARVPAKVARAGMHVRQVDLEERRIIEFRVRHALAAQPVWGAEALWAAVREPLMDRGNFEVVVRNLAFDRARPLAPPLEAHRTLVRLRGDLLAVLPFVGRALEAGRAPAPDCPCDPAALDRRGVAAGAAGAALLLAPEAYLQTRPPPGRQEITLRELEARAAAASFPEEVEQARARLAGLAGAALRGQARAEARADLAFEVAPRVHREIIRGGVEAAWDGARKGPGEAKCRRDFPEAEFYREFRMLLTAADLDKGARGAAALPPETPRGAPVGYAASTPAGGRTWWVYAPPGAAAPQGRWVELPRLAAPPPDNPVIVGFQERGAFKLRTPGALTRRSDDQRKRERGMVCSSFRLPQLQSLGKRLRLALAGVPQAQAAIPETDVPGHLCLGLRRALILAEAAAGGRTHWFGFGE